MTTNPSPEAEEPRDQDVPANAETPAADEAATAAEEPNAADSETAKDEPATPAPAAASMVSESLRPAAPKLTTELDASSIVNLDYQEDDGAILSNDQMLSMINQYEETLTEIQEGQIVPGTVVEVRETEVLLNIGFKSEGVIPIEEFGDQELSEGDTFDVFLDKIENQDGLVVLSKERADFLKVWDKIKQAHETGDVVAGTVDRRIKGGLVVKLWGVDTFLPGSQVALRQVPNLEDMIGEEIQCRIIKKNKRRRNVVVSRRIVLEQEREEKKRKLIAELEKGQIRTGVVKNITDFGAFVDLGGIDGLLHITDLSWGRVAHPSEVVGIGEEIEVKVLDFEQQRERISLGLKQCETDPWLTLVERFPVGTIIEGKVRNLTDFGAFVEVEEGIDGLVHISDMSWTKRVRHPKEVLRKGESVAVQILDIDAGKRRISLGIKQLQENPWPTLAEDYPVGHNLEGQVGRMLDHGVIVELENELEGFVPLGHLGIPQLDKPQYYFKEGEKIELKVIKMDVENRRIVLSIAERLKDDEPEALDAFIADHPRLEDVVAAEEAAAAAEAGDDGAAAKPEAPAADEPEAPAAAEPAAKAEADTAEEPEAENEAQAAATEPEPEAAAATEPETADAVEASAAEEEPVAETEEADDAEPKRPAQDSAD
jgi:small subunit ribosomal protein S1